MMSRSRSKDRKIQNHTTRSPNAIRCPIQQNSI